MLILYVVASGEPLLPKEGENIVREMMGKRGCGDKGRECGAIEGHHHAHNASGRLRGESKVKR